MELTKANIAWVLFGTGIFCFILAFWIDIVGNPFAGTGLMLIISALVISLSHTKW